MNSDSKVLYLTDEPAGAMAEDLRLLYPERVESVDFTTTGHEQETLDRYTHVVTRVADGSNLTAFDYAAVVDYARRGGQVVSCLFEYAHHFHLHFSKTHVGDRVKPGMRIEVENEITRGYARGDVLWWFGCVSGAPDTLYENQMVQRQLLGVRESGEVRVLATSTLNGGAVMVEHRVGEGRIVAMDLASPGRPFYNSHGATNKYLFLGNVVGGSVRWGHHYPRRLDYDGVVAEMKRMTGAYPRLGLNEEGACSDGRMMYSFSIGDPELPTLYLGAAIHGWEWENAFGLLRFAHLLCENPTLEGLDAVKLHFRIVPVQNPHGYDRFVRQNARGVDLNRNFDCAWSPAVPGQDVPVPWDFSYPGSAPASEAETRVMQGIVERDRPLCLIDFHTADYVMMYPCKGDTDLLDAIHQGARERLRDRFITQRPYGGPFQQVNMERTHSTDSPRPYFMDFAAQSGVRAAFLIEMSGNRDDVHGLVMNTETVVQIALAAVAECLAATPSEHG